MKTMKVAELKASVRMHNRAYAIRGYSHMNKGSLVDALAKQDRNSFCTLSIMVNAHNKSRDELKVMKVAELKTLVRKHNLDNAIRRYSKMKKSELVDALMKHSTSDKPAAKPAPKPAAKKPAAKKPKLEVVKEKKKAAPKKEDDDLYDDFFDNVGKGKVTGAKSKAAIAFSAKVAKDKAERRALERNDPAAYEAKMNAIHAAQQLPSQSELFDMKKKAARQKKPAAKKPAASKGLSGDLLKLKEILLAQKPIIVATLKREAELAKAEPGVSYVSRLGGFAAYNPDHTLKYIDDQVKRLEASAGKTSGAKLPTLEEMGLTGGYTGKVSSGGNPQNRDGANRAWMGMTKRAVTTFLKGAKKPAAKKEFVYMIPGLAELGRSKGQPEKYIEEQRKAEAFAKDFLKRRAAFLAGTGPAPPFGEEAKFNLGKDNTRRHALSIKFLLVTKPAMEAFAKTPEGIAKAARERKSVASKLRIRRAGIESRAKEREAARAAKKAAKETAKKGGNK